MGRKVNSTFQGSTESECRQGSYMHSTTVGNAIGDTAMVFDMLTGENSWAGSIIDHTGPGTGVPLGVPLAQCAIRATDHRFRAPDTTYDIIYLTGHPIYLPRGETEIRVELRGKNFGSELTFEVRDTSWVKAGSYNFYSGQSMRGAQITGLTGGSIYFVMSVCEVGAVADYGGFEHVSGYKCYFSRMANDGVEVPGSETLGQGAAPVDTQASGTAEILNPTDWDDGEIATDQPVHAQMTTRLNRFQNGLAEFVSGHPAGSIEPHSLQPSSGRAPTTSAYHDHSKSTYANELTPDMPICGEPLGAFNYSSGDYKTSSWGAPALAAAATTKTAIMDVVCFLPDFQATNDTSRLRVAFLIGDPNGTNSGFSTPTIYVQTRDSSGSAATEESAGTTWMGATKFGYSVVGSTTGTGNRIDFTPDEANGIKISLEDAKNATTGDGARLLGYCIYFQGE